MVGSLPSIVCPAATNIFRIPCTFRVRLNRPRNAWTAQIQCRAPELASRCATLAHPFAVIVALPEQEIPCLNMKLVCLACIRTDHNFN